MSADDRITEDSGAEDASAEDASAENSGAEDRASERVAERCENQIALRAWGQSRVNAAGRVNAGGDVQIGDRHHHEYRPAVAPPKNSTGIEINPENRSQEAWVNRERVQRELLEKVADSKTILVEMIGAGGAGKTSLAAWLHDAVDRRDFEVVWLRLSAAADFYTVAQWVLHGLRVPVDEQTDVQTLAKLLVSNLRQTKCLLVLDQIEKIAANEDAPLFEDFLSRWMRQGAGSTVLVTTRQPFVQDEARRLPLPGFTPSEGEIFLTRLGVVADSAESLRELTKICGGHPLLLKLSASWLKETDRTLTKDYLGFFEQLFKRDLGDPEAQVKEIFERLLAQLPERVRRMLLDASVYRGAFGLARAQAMVSEIALEDLEGLEAQGFLLVQEEMWRLHPLVNELVVEVLRAEGEEETAHRKAIEYFKVRIEAETTDIQDYLECFYHCCECQNFESAYDTAISLFSLGISYAKIDEHWKSRDHFQQAKALFSELKLAHMVEDCEQAIQERNKIIAGIPKKAPPLPAKAAEPDWWTKSLPKEVRSQNTPTQKQSLPRWLPYLAIVVIVALIVITLQ